MRWLDFRGRFGFSEYNADTYGPISFAPLVTVAALAPDPEVPPTQSAYFLFPFLGEDSRSYGAAPPDLRLDPCVAQRRNRKSTWESNCTWQAA